MAGVAILPLLFHVSFAQPGSLDNTFGANGKLVVSLDNFGDQANSVAIQGDGKIVFGGFTNGSFTSSDFALARCNNDGSLDAGFGTGGKVITPIEGRSHGNAVAIQSDGKIVLGGSSNWYINLVRYTADGALDTGFGSAGKVITDVEGYYSEKCRSVVVQSNGKILVGGYGQHNANDNSYFMLLRYHADGTLDNTFGAGGIVIGGLGQGNSLAVQSDGKILIGGSSNFAFALTRYHTNGTLDSSFGTGGTVITPVGSSSLANALCIQSDGKILLGGYSHNGSDAAGFALARYKADGTLDDTFGTNGTVITYIGNSSATGNAISTQSDGKIVLAGYAKNSANYNDVALARYHSNGALDDSFGQAGKVITPVGPSYSVANSLAIQSDGKMVLGGYRYNGSKTDMLVLRYDAEDAVGVNDPALTSPINRIYPNPFSSSATLVFNVLHPNTIISIYNTLGQEVKRIDPVTEKEIQLYRDDLPGGMYFLRVVHDNKIIAIQQLFICPS